MQQKENITQAGPDPEGLSTGGGGGRHPRFPRFFYFKKISSPCNKKKKKKWKEKVVFMLSDAFLHILKPVCPLVF